MNLTPEQKAISDDLRENGKLAKIESIARKCEARHVLALAQIARIVYATRAIAGNPLVHALAEAPVTLLDQSLCELGKLFPEFLSIQTLTLCQTPTEAAQEVVLDDLPEKGLFEEVYDALMQDCEEARERNELFSFEPENGHVN